MRWFVEFYDVYKGSSYRRRWDESYIHPVQLFWRAKTWVLKRKLHDSYSFKSRTGFKSRLKETFEPPRAKLLASAEFLELKQGGLGVHAYAQHIR